ncbi:MAG: putative Na+/H+ antiporter [Halobacteriovoraceae bacterium]|nr:putative Na+/H+ antiporter [Halobacteriovoraceae bacterium]
MAPTTIQILATVIFALALIHTFVAKKFENMAHHYPVGSMGENLFHFLGEVEVVFGLWSSIFLLGYSILEGFAVWDTEHHHVIGGALHYLDSTDFTEPAFVFVIMCVAGTRPIIITAEKCIMLFSKLIPLPSKMAFYVSTLVLGPLLGSFITEPAAMTVTALILLDYFYSSDISQKFKYATLGLLFVNVSIGGTLTHFAAPPVLMVAGAWKWGTMHMLAFFGYKAAFAVIMGTLIVAFYFKDELRGNLEVKQKHENYMVPSWWIILIHLVFLGLVVMTAHHPKFFLGLFLFFLGFTQVTQEYQDPIKLKESLLVGFFLSGLVTLGGMQKWWIQPLIESLSTVPLFLGTTALTAITDNALLTYLGRVAGIASDAKKYFLVAGAVCGGGLTVIANAPNPAGFGILKGSFGESGITPLGLLKAAILPTIIAMLCFGFLPNL